MTVVDVAGEALDLADDRDGSFAEGVQGVSDRLLVGLVLGARDDALAGQPLKPGRQGDRVGAGSG
jgi:hypothetical protein